MASKPIDVHPDLTSQVTLQDYSRGPVIEGVALVDLARFVDDGGSFLELGRLSKGLLADCGVSGFELCQISYSVMDPRAIKAFHLHVEQSEFWFVPPISKLIVGLYDVRADSKTAKTSMRLALGDGQSQLLYIPAGVAHGASNPGVGPAQIVYFTDRQFSADPNTSDEKRLPWDLLGADFFRMQRG